MLELALPQPRRAPDRVLERPPLRPRRCSRSPASAADDVPAARARRRGSPASRRAKTAPAPRSHAVVELILEHAETRPDESPRRHRDGHQARRTASTSALRDALRDRAGARRVLRRGPATSGSSSRTSSASRATSATRSSSRSATARTPTASCSTASARSTHEGGERRLNVAITRARRRMTARLVVHRRRHGPRALQAPTASSCCASTSQYAESRRREPRRRGRDEARRSTRSSSTSATRSTPAGIPLVAQYGVVRLPDRLRRRTPRTGRFVLAIECDGATYHSHRQRATATGCARNSSSASAGASTASGQPTGSATKIPPTAKAVTAYRAAVEIADADDRDEQQPQPNRSEAQIDPR